MTDERELPDSNVANVGRMRQYAEALVGILRDDPRVNAAYQAYQAAHRVPAAGPIDLTDLRQVFLHDRAQDLETIGHLVRESLGLPYTWLAAALVSDFGVRAAAAVLGVEPAHVTLESSLPAEERPTDRRPLQEGGTIRRDVEWFYRTRVKHPPDTIDGLYREHVEQPAIAKAANSRAEAQAAIRRAEEFLSALNEPGPGQT